ncbi:MAG: hypothetical protein ACYDDF_11030 [Thermoplasmatota archaeon]
MDWPRPPNWRLVAELAPGGAVVGLGTVVGTINSNVEPFAWVVLGVIWVVVIYQRDKETPFATGLVVGALGGMITPILQAALFPVYVANNPDMVPIFESVPPNFPWGPTGFILLSGILVSAVFGFVTGWTASLMVRSRRQKAAVDALESSRKTAKKRARREARR